MKSFKNYVLLKRNGSAKSDKTIGMYKRDGKGAYTTDEEGVGEARGYARVPANTETPAERETRMKSSFTKVRGKPDFNARQKTFVNQFYVTHKRSPNKQELRAAGVGKGGDNPAGEKAWKAAMQ